MVAFKYCKDKDVLLELLKQKPDLTIKHIYDRSVLDYAFKHCNDKEVLLEILKQKPDLNIQNIHGYNITMVAFEYCNDKDVLLELLKQCPDLTKKDTYNKTVLDYAFKHYVKSPQFEFYVLEKLYDENCKQDKHLFNPEYLKLRNKYKIFPLVLFRYKSRYGKYKSR